MTRRQHAVVWLSLVGIALLFWGLAPLQGYPPDMRAYKYWMVLVTEHGVGSAYSGEFPQTYSDYPPVFLYFLRAIGGGYQVLVDRTLDVQTAIADNRLSVAIKSPGIIFHLLLTLALIRIHQQEYGFKRAYFVAMVYGVHPAVVLDVAYWGQPDSIHTFFAVLGIRLLLRKQPLTGWAMLGLGAWTKAQTWWLLPLAGVLTLSQRSLRGVLEGLTALGIVSLIVTSPFVLQGTFGELIQLPTHMVTIHKFASANANNLWWAITEGGYRIDTEPWLGGISYAAWGYFFVALLGLLGVVAMLRVRREDVPEIFALMTFGFVMLATKAHENHTFQTLGLLAAAGLFQGYRRLLFAAISMTLFMNLVLFSPDVFEWLKARLGHDAVISASVFNARVNLLILALWLTMVAGKLRQGRSARAPSTAAVVVRDS